MKRFKMSRRSNRRSFKIGANRVHSKNLISYISRGGVRG